jgi:hypothetical protein
MNYEYIQEELICNNCKDNEGKNLMSFNTFGIQKKETKPKNKNKCTSCFEDLEIKPNKSREVKIKLDENTGKIKPENEVIILQ